MIDVGTSKKFARAYVAQNSGHKFTDLQELCDTIQFVTNGYEEEETLLYTVVSGLQNFSPRRDIIVPVGNVFVNVLVGMVAAELSKEWGHFYVALYRDKVYHVQAVSLSTIGDLINVYKSAQQS
jgi:hypothetical protein